MAKVWLALLAVCWVAAVCVSADTAELVEGVKASLGTAGEVRKFKIKVGEGVVEDLKRRLRATRWPDQLTDVNADDWSYGIPVQQLKPLVEHWEKEYNWKQWEQHLNEQPQFVVNIDGLNIHFVHVKATVARYPHATPLLFVHGWPGSFFECYKLIPLLTDPLAHGGKEEDAFDVVCPSLPGYGFSDAPSRKGFDALETSKTFLKLMDILGYDKYFLQGGDWGSVVTSLMAQAAPNHVLGLHLNMIPTMQPLKKGFGGFFRTLYTYAFPSLALEPEEAAAFPNVLASVLKESGYFHEQSTKPQTLGYGLTDSPVGLAAWIIEKFHTWSDCKGQLTSVYTYDELLTNVMVYWVTGSITSSTRFYYEFVNSNNNLMFDAMHHLDVKVPTACAIFPVELVPPIKSWVKYFYNVVQYNRFTSGGHFAAMEKPDVLVQDVRAFRALVVEKYLKPAQTPQTPSTEGATQQPQTPSIEDVAAVQPEL